MTALVGIACDDGIVIGTDSSSTLSAGEIPTIEQKTKKLFCVADKVIMAVTGSVGLAQRFQAILERAWAPGGHFATNNLPAIEIAKYLSREMLQDMGFTFIQKINVGALVAFEAEEKLHLVEYAVTDFQPEFKNQNPFFVSMGSGQVICDPFMGLMRRVFWQDDQPSVGLGLFTVAWTLEHVIGLNPGGIAGPAQIASLTRNAENKLTAKVLSDNDLLEHRNFATKAEEHLSKFLFFQEEGGDAPIPPGLMPEELAKTDGAKT